MARHCFAQLSHAFLQAVISAMPGDLAHSLLHASQAAAQALHIAGDIGPLRAHIFSAARQISWQSAEICADFSCSFIPAFTIAVQCLLHVWQASAHALHAAAHLLKASAPGAAITAFMFSSIATAKRTANNLRDIIGAPFKPHASPSGDHGPFLYTPVTLDLRRILLTTHAAQSVQANPSGCNNQRSQSPKSRMMPG
jgi:hypothetical protein